MTLEQLRIFLEVAAQEHVTRAAERLHLTQSAVSASVAALEARHAVKLFDRVGRRIALTEAGRMFVPEAKAILARVEAAELGLADLSGLAAGLVRLHASQTVANYWLPQRLVRFREAFPNVRLELSVGNTAQVARSVADGAADLGVVEGAVNLAELDRRTVASDRLVLVVGRDHPWASGQAAGPRDLLETTWILRESGSGTRSEFEQALQRLALSVDDLPVVLELPSNEAVCAAVAAGTSASVLSERAVLPGLSTGRLAAVDLDLPARSFIAVRHRERYLTRASSALLDLLEETSEAGAGKHVRAGAAA